MNWKEILGLNFKDVRLRSMTADELKSHSRMLVDAMKAKLDEADAENRDVSKTEVDALDEAQKHLDAVQAELKARPVNQPPSMHFTSGENPQTATAYGAIGKRYAELFDTRTGVENNEDTEQFLARAFSQRTMAVGSGIGGGFLVPSQLWSSVFDAALAKSIALPRCRVFPMETSSLTIPALDSEDQSEGWTSGITAQWRAEGATFDIRTPKLRQINLFCSKYGLFVNCTSEILQDAPNLESTVRQILIDGVTQGIDSAVIDGDGVGKPLGILSSPCAVVVPRATSSLISFTDISNMYARLHPSMIAGSCWLGSPNILPQLLTLSDPGNSYIWLPSAAGVSGPSPGSLLGLPLLLSDKLPELGSRGDLVLTNLNYYALGIRKNATVESTNAAYWTADTVSFRVLMRVAGTFLLDNSITAANGSSDDLSCCVILDA